MNKSIILIVAVMVIFVNSFSDVYADSDEECFQELEIGGFKQTQSGVDAFLHAYYDLNVLIKYFDEIFYSATEGFKDVDVLSPLEWCIQKYIHGIFILTGHKKFKPEISSIEALKHSYRNDNQHIINVKNDEAKDYYKYMIDTYKPILLTKRIRNPIEYCTGQPAKGLPSNYAGYYVDQTVSNEDTNIQDQARNKNAEEESIQTTNVVLDNEGREIDLNRPYNKEQHIDENQGHVLNDEESSHITEVNISPKLSN